MSGANHPTPEEQDQEHLERLWRLKKVAQSAGYTLTEHGSMKRDIDLVAVPWVAEAVEPARLIGLFLSASGGFVTTIDCKPHGRIGVIMQGFGPKMWDISVFPPRGQL